MIPRPGKIQRSGPRGTHINQPLTRSADSEELLISEPFGNYFGIAVNPSGGKVYWTSLQGGLGQSYLRRANLDGTGIEVLFEENSANFWGVAVDSAGGKVYWTDAAGERIRRANLNGSAVEILVENAGQARGIALAPQTGAVYWVSALPPAIRRAGFDGSNPADVLTMDIVSPAGIALEPSTADAVPAANQWGLAILILCLLTAGTVAAGRVGPMSSRSVR
ncbi:MAG: hypothetical protein ACE5EX_00210 [Phycisphaerae bacterium]